MSKKVYMKITSSSDTIILPEVKYTYKADENWKYDCTIMEKNLYYKNFELMSIPPVEFQEKVLAIDGILSVEVKSYK